MTTISEIGILETLKVVSIYSANNEHVELYLPIVSEEYIGTRIEQLSDVIINTGKTAVFMMLPELALMECLAIQKWGGKAILALPFDMDVESKDRIHSNIPEGINTVFVEEGAYPTEFRPNNGIIVCTGIVPSSYRQYLLPSCCRMMSQYKVFEGERMLLSCFPPKTRTPEVGWSYTDHDFFNQIIEEGQTI